MIRFVAAPVRIVGMGLVASAAALILLAVPKDRRLGLPNSHYLIHQPLSGIRGVATEIRDLCARFVLLDPASRAVPDAQRVDLYDGVYAEYAALSAAVAGP